MSTPAKTSANQRLLTIGTVTRRLQEEFPEISISKIRYLEDQGLLAPRRTQGGYRLFSEEDVERLETILRLQRDEFLPLRVIREELSSPGVAKGTKRRRSGLSAAEDELDIGELCERAGITASLARELEEFGLLAPRNDNGTKLYGEGDVEQSCTVVDAQEQQHPAGDQGEAHRRQGAPGTRASRRPASGETIMKGRMVGR